MELNSLGHSVNEIDRVHMVLSKMMALRGYEKLVHTVKPPSAEPVIIAHRTQEGRCTAREKEIYIFITTEPKLGIDHVRKFQKVALAAKIDHIILVHGNGGITPSTTTKIAALQANGLYVETFKMSALAFYPVLTPYTILDGSSGNDNVQPAPDKCQTMEWDDIQRRFHDWPVDTVVRRPRQRGNLCEDYCIRIVKGPTQ